MPNYYNPWAQNYPTYSGVFSNNSQTQVPVPQPIAPQPVQVNPMMAWVDGEYAARSFQIPANHPLGQPYPIWDSNDMVIYLKTMDQYGRPMPLRKLRYTVEEEAPQNKLMNGASGSDHSNGNIDMSQYVTKADLDELRNEIRKMNNQNNGGKQNG